MQCLLLKRLRVSCFSASSINLSVTHKYLSLSRYVAYIPIQIHGIRYLHTDNAGYSTDHFERSCKKTPFKKEWWKEDIAVWEFPLTKSLDRHIINKSLMYAYTQKRSCHMVDAEHNTSINELLWFWNIEHKPCHKILLF